MGLILVYDFKLDFGIWYLFFHLFIRSNNNKFFNSLVDLISIVYVLTYSPILYFTCVKDSEYLISLKYPPTELLFNRSFLSFCITILTLK